jgi:plastocyanin
MKRLRRGLSIVSLLMAAVAVMPVTAARAATRNVSEQGTVFVPKQVSISVGDTVVWTYESSSSGPGHTVTFDNGPDLNPGCEPNALLPVNCQTRTNPVVQRTFTSVGTFPYHCKIHGGAGGQGMAGVVVVSALTTTTTTAPGSSTSTTARVSSSPTTATARATSSSSTTTTTRQLATSSTVLRSSTTTSATSSALLPGAPPPFSDDTGSNASGRSGGSHDGADTGTVALIVGLLLAVSGGGGYLLWRLRPGRA